LSYIIIEKSYMIHTLNGTTAQQYMGMGAGRRRGRMGEVVKGRVGKDRKTLIPPSGVF